AAPDDPEAGAAGPDAGASPALPGPFVPSPRDPAFAGPAVRACSVRDPICVRAPAATDGRAVLAALAAGERAWETITGALAAPAPDGDDGGRYVVDLVADVPGGAQ